MAPATKRKASISHNKTYTSKKLKKQEKTTDQLDKKEKAMVKDTIFIPHLPDLVIHKIFHLIPTKPGVRASIVSKQWAGVWSFGVPIIDFDEGDDDPACDDHDHDKLGKRIERKKLFIRFLERCLKWHEKLGKPLDRFKLHMRYDPKLMDATSTVDKWLCFAVERGVQELDLCLQRKDGNNPAIVVETEYYCIPKSLLMAKVLITSLHLEYVKIDDVTTDADPICLPSLRTMSLGNVIFENNWAIFYLVRGCPSIEHLSLTSCSFSSSAVQSQLSLKVLGSSLKSLQVMYCEFLSIVIIEVMNLEYFTLVSEFALLDVVGLHSCCNLKYISISCQHLNRLGLIGMYQDSVNVTIDATNLRSFCFEGYLKPDIVISTNAQNLSVSTITLGWDQEDDTFQWPGKHVPTLSDFLQNFDCSKNMSLDIMHDAVAKALIFPRDCRKTLCPPLRNVKKLEVRLIHSARTEGIAACLGESLRWMAPSVQKLSMEYLDSDSDSD